MFLLEFGYELKARTTREKYKFHTHREKLHIFWEILPTTSPIKTPKFAS